MTDVRQLETELTAARLAVNDWHACASNEELARWRAAQGRLIDAAQAVGRATIDVSWQTAALLKDRTRRAMRDRLNAGEAATSVATDYGVPVAFVTALGAWQLSANPLDWPGHDLWRQKRREARSMTTEPTPGPWKVQPAIGTYIGTVGDPYGHGQMHIADVRGWGHLTGRGACAFSEDQAIEIQEANARLLAAAPDLLAALKAIVAVLQKEASGTALNHHQYDAVGSQAHAAIARAEGR